MENTSLTSQLRSSFIPSPVFHASDQAARRNNLLALLWSFLFLSFFQTSSSCCGSVGDVFNHHLWRVVFISGAPSAKSVYVSFFNTISVKCNFC